jgi:hypothetical protein
MGKFWIIVIGLPLMLMYVVCSGITHLWTKASDAINDSRLPDLRHGTYTLADYPPDPYYGRPDNTVVDPYIITFTRVVVNDKAVQVDAVARNITTTTKTLDCVRDSTSTILQWMAPTVRFSSGSVRDVGGFSFCAGPEEPVTVKPGGTVEVATRFALDKRFTRPFVLRWGACRATDRQHMCVRFTTEHTIDIGSAARS